MTSTTILQRFRHNSSAEIVLTIRQPYLDLLERLGNPHEKLPPVVHVAGTNGKGSTCAFLRAMIEAAGYKAHVYTSPHLISVRERIRIAGQLISEEEFAEILAECERHSSAGDITYFEAVTAAAFVAFARHPADVTILEVGLGGRLDATNVIPQSAATVITRLSLDHRDYLGETIADIAREKAGIMRQGVPCFVAPQPDTAALAELERVSGKLHAPLVVGGRDWRVEIKSPSPQPLSPPRGGEGLPPRFSEELSSTPERSSPSPPLGGERGWGEGDFTFRFTGPARSIDLPCPALLGRHQLWNAGLAVSTLAALPVSISDEAVRKAMRAVEWSARLQRITDGKLHALLPEGWELWLDGGHNDSAGEVLAAQAEAWERQDGDAIRPLRIVLGMLSSKSPQEFLRHLVPYIDRMATVTIDGEPQSRTAEDLAAIAKSCGIDNARAARNPTDAINALVEDTTPPCRILICGSLYLAGQILKI